MCLTMSVTSHCRQYCQHESGGQLTFLHSALYKRRMPCRRWTRRSAEHSGRYASCYVLSPHTVRELRWSVAGCPVVTSDFNPSNLMPQSSNQPTPGQSQPLGRQRVPSTIPVGMHVQPARCNFAFLAGPNLLFVAIAASVHSLIVEQLMMEDLRIRKLTAPCGCILVNKCSTMP